MQLSVSSIHFPGTEKRPGASDPTAPGRAGQVNSVNRRMVPQKGYGKYTRAASAPGSTAFVRTGNCFSAGCQIKRAQPYLLPKITYNNTMYIGILQEKVNPVNRQFMLSCTFIRGNPALTGVCFYFGTAYLSDCGSVYKRREIGEAILGEVRIKRF